MQKGKITKYRPLPAIDLQGRTWPNNTITKAPKWCSVDLRDGNQALAIPMNVSEKLEMFDMLVKIGFKEIEIGFPSAAQTEFDFCRKLIDENRIPEGVSIQILTQAREHLIRRSFEALQGAPEATVHMYNSTSPLQRKITFGNASKEKIKEIAINGTKLVKELASTISDTKLHFQYSPESFSDTELDFSLEVCEAVMEIWEPTEKEPIILNLPATVEWSTPNIHADQVEWFCQNLKERQKAIISLHTHNDRGTSVAATELAIMAGADRVEGTLFGNGERTGNLDVVTVALNMYAQGIDPELNFDNLSTIREVYERTTRMEVPPRQPYAGELVFTAFSGSHQDAVKKGLDPRKEAKDKNTIWEVPYLAIDPEDIGRSYEAIIRINSQSGKGGVAYILSREYGLDLPKTMHPEIGIAVNHVADTESKELDIKEIYEIFLDEYIRNVTPLNLLNYKIDSQKVNGDDISLSFEVEHNGSSKTISGDGNGPINALVKAINSEGWKNFKLMDYRSHAIGGGSDTRSAAYIQIRRTSDDKLFWGCGINTNIEMAGLKALVSAFNKAQ